MFLGFVPCCGETPGHFFPMVIHWLQITKHFDMESHTYLLPPDFSEKKLRKKLPVKSSYSISLDGGETQETTLLDTFDGEVHASNKLLFQLPKRLLLADLTSGGFVEQEHTGEWSLAEDLAEGPVASQLLDISKLRAFLPIAEATLRCERGGLLDDESKTRARFQNMVLGADGKIVGITTTNYLRGYDKAYGDLCASLEKIGATPYRNTREIYDLLGTNLREYTAKPSITLLPQGPAKESATMTIRSFLSVARQNEEGIIADYDTEFLHDYRVSLRKVRSVLSLFKGVYNGEETTSLKEEFSGLMRQTNLLRDLDVYLLNRSQYFQLVPDDTHEGLTILFDYISSLRRKEQKKVRKILRTKNYNQQMKQLKKLFADDSRLASGPKGGVDSLGYACRLVIKRYRKVCSIARTINKHTDDAVVHELRINCKKLRYLMEFFAPLFPASEIKTLIKALKLLQDNLGNFNDYSVQQLFLRQMLGDKMVTFGRDQLQVAESIGALTAMLHRLQLKERGQVMKNFARFDSVETRNAFTDLFQTKGRAA
ncbi:MAG: CHAD domain-containing protein [Desulforhopalus sp.]